MNMNDGNNWVHDDQILSAVNGGPDNRFRLEMIFDDCPENPRLVNGHLWTLKFNEESNFCSVNEFEGEAEVDYDDIHDLIMKGWTVVSVFWEEEKLIAGQLQQLVKTGEFLEGKGRCHGYAYLHPEAADKLNRSHAAAILQAELEELSAYFRGDTFCFVLYENGEEVECSCNWFGDDREIRIAAKDTWNSYDVPDEGFHVSELFGQLAYDRIDPRIEYEETKENDENDMVDKTRNNTDLATLIITKFEQFRDLYTILVPDEHCVGGVRMVGQIHVIRNWKDIYKAEFQSIEASMWLELSGNYTPEITIKDGIQLNARSSQTQCISALINKHLEEFLASNRWTEEDWRRYGGDFRNENDWIRFLEQGGLVVIKQTL